MSQVRQALNFQNIITMVTAEYTIQSWVKLIQ